MFVLGLQGSPRKKGNTDYLLNTFMQAAADHGALTHVIDTCRQEIVPCKELVVCEKKGYCPIDDEMSQDMYTLVRRANVIVAATPIFFYNATAQLKAFIDRCQTLWARKYKLRLRDPLHHTRRGFVLSVAASRGKQLFDGLKLTMQYFFDATDAAYAGELTYRGIEKRGDMQDHPTVREEVTAAVGQLLTPLTQRKRILFLCRENAGRSQMAGAFANMLAGERIEAVTGGSEPAQSVNPLMIEAMAEKKIDMAFAKPRSIEAALREGPPGMIITMGCGEHCPYVPGAKMMDWDLPDPSGRSIAFMRQIRDEIEKRVTQLVAETP